MLTLDRGGRSRQTGRPQAPRRSLVSGSEAAQKICQLPAESRLVISRCAEPGGPPAGEDRRSTLMTAVVWANILLAIPFLVAFIAVPLWWTFKRPPASPDHTEAHAYLRTRTAFAEALARRQ